MENVSVQDIVRATGGVLLSGNSAALLNKIGGGRGPLCADHR